VQELVAVAKASPGKLTCGSQGIGTASHLTAELFMALTGTKLVHVPYKGGTSGVLNDVVAGHLDLSFIQFSAAHELQRSGKLTVLAVATDKRLEVLPDVPTMAEAGFPEVVGVTWTAVLVPTNTPKDIVTQLNRLIVASLALPDIKERLAAMAYVPIGNSPDDCTAFFKSEMAIWSKVIKAAGIRAD
jgi:tripartite-type tricarboxylate transporter receptor subunit TctC